MGVYYSTTLGYGLLVDSERFKAIAGIEGYLGEEELDEWAENNDCSHLEIVHCGDFMSGETYILFAIPGTVSRMNIHYAEKPLEFTTPLLNTHEKIQLESIREQFKLDTMRVTWKLVPNIS